jgi:hypothetical protein
MGQGTAPKFTKAHERRRWSPGDDRSGLKENDGGMSQVPRKLAGTTDHELVGDQIRVRSSVERRFKDMVSGLADYQGMTAAYIFEPPGVGVGHRRK